MNQTPHTTLSLEAREHVGSILNHALADEFALSSAARDYHWNVSGPSFRSLYELFDEQYHQLDEWIEKIGVRARSLGITAQSGWTELIQAARLAPAAGASLSAAGMMQALMSLHENMVGRLREDALRCVAENGDGGTADFLSELIEYHETAAWMLGELLDDRERAQA